MPYKDPEMKRAYYREYKRMLRGSQTQCQTRSQTQCQTLQTLKVEYRIKNAKDVLELLERTINEVENLRCESNGEVLSKARTIGFLTGYLLKAIEIGELEQRISSLEEILKIRKRED
jgi:hypothetical protein